MCEKIKNFVKLINISKTIELYKEKEIYQIIRGGSFNAILEQDNKKIIIYNRNNPESKNANNNFVFDKNHFYNLFEIVFQERIIHNTINTRKEIGVKQTIAKLEKNKIKIATLCAFVLCLLSMLFIKETYQTLIIVAYLVIVLLTVTITIKLIILLKAILTKDDDNDKEKILQCKEINKKYTVLIPLYKEHHLVPQIVQNINNLHYPKHLLDVKIILEEDDAKTIKAARKIVKEDHFHIIIVPNYQPKTKPKALNYASHFIEGEYVVIYDAEDMPDTDQLLKMASIFENRKDCNIAQGILTFYNKFDNGLTVCFDIEYYQWFRYFIKGLYMYGIQIPLGGTTNHFRYEFLKKLNFWDAYNVTEDLELSCIPHQKQIYFLNSQTQEWATNNLKGWMKQRSRWLKGYLLTYITYSKLYSKLNIKNFIFFQIIIGATCLLFAIMPLTTIMFIMLKFYHINQVFEFELKLMGVATLLYYGTIIIVYMDEIKHKMDNKYLLVARTIASIVVYPFYFLLHGVAMYIAIYEIFKKPFFWHKTKHSSTGE